MPSAFEHGPTLTVVASPTANAGVIWSAANNLGQSTVLLGTGTLGISGDTDIITLTANTVTVAGTVAATTLTGSGAGITALAAGNIATGTVPTARLGSGTANNSVFLRGDGTWAAAGGGPTINNATENELVTVANNTANLDAEANLLYSSPALTIQSSNSVPAQLIVHGYADGSIDGPGRISLRRSVNSSIGGNGAPTVGGHNIGIIDFEANDGNSVELGAAIRVNSTEDWDDSSRGNRMRFFTTANGSTSPLAVMSIDGSGYVGIGVSAPVRPLHVAYTQSRAQIRVERNGGTSADGIATLGAGDDQFSVMDSSYTRRFNVFTATGNVTGTHGSYHTSSDIRVKENVVTLDSGLAELMQLRPVKFNFKESQLIGVNPRFGFIAQEIETVLPEVVFTAPDPEEGEEIPEVLNVKSIEDMQIISVIVKAIQELNEKVEALS